jgi:hypothetical protein
MWQGHRQHVRDAGLMLVWGTIAVSVTAAKLFDPKANAWGWSDGRAAAVDDQRKSEPRYGA